MRFLQMSIFEKNLPTNSANYVPLSPISFLKRAAQVVPEKIAIIDGNRQYTYKDFYRRSTMLATALHNRGLKPGTCIAILAGNIPEMLEAHNGVPLMGGVLNSLNTRLDAETISFILEHGESKVLLADDTYAPLIEEVLEKLKKKILIIRICDPSNIHQTELGDIEYEEFLTEGINYYEFDEPKDEWQALSLLYTSGTTGNPKGCVYHHRGAYLSSLGNMQAFGLDNKSIYLWTLPMFHCDGWTFTWAVTAAQGTHICLRKIDPANIFKLISDKHVTHMCGAPIILNMLINAPENEKISCSHQVQIATGGAAPPSIVIEKMEQQGFIVTHLYGLTETYGPATVCLLKEEWGNLKDLERASLIARQGVHYGTLEDSSVKDPNTMKDVPWDAKTIGEVMIRGNTVMKGYLKNQEATENAFKDGWLRTGDLAVRHPDSYIEIKDRSKDIIISGGENISSLEIEEVLYRHPNILEAAVVAKPDEHWGESPCAFITLKDGITLSAEEVITYCRQQMAHFKVPKTIVVCSLPKTSTGKIQKFLLRHQASQL